MTGFVEDRITIWYARKNSLEQTLVYEVRVQVELGHRQLGWSMTMLPGQIVPIHLLAINQQLILIAGENELLIDSSGLQREFPLQFQEGVSEQGEKELEG